MSRIVFENQRPALTASVACRHRVLRRLGAAHRDGACLGPSTSGCAMAAEPGLADGSYARDVSKLLDVPVPVDNYAGSMTIFDSVDATSTIGTADYLAATVRSFFAQGGKRCYVVRMGDPIPTDPSITAAEDARIKQQMLQSVLVSPAHQASDPSTWHGVGHLSGLTDVSYLAVPDLPILSASMPTPALLAPLPAPAAPCSSRSACPSSSRWSNRSRTRRKRPV